MAAGPSTHLVGSQMSQPTDKLQIMDMRDKKAISEYLLIPFHTLFQVSTSGALVKGIYQGAVSTGELLHHGDFGGRHRHRPNTRAYATCNREY